MSKRYGRNQKRRHREEITRLKQEIQIKDMFAVRKSQIHDQLKESYNNLSKAFQELKENLEDVVSKIEEVSYYSSVLPMKDFKGDTKGLKQMRVDIRDKPKFTVTRAVDINCVFKVVDVYALEVILKENRETFQHSVHLRYHTGKESAVMLSETMFRRISDRRFYRQVVELVSEQLAIHIRKQ